MEQNETEKSESAEADQVEMASSETEQENLENETNESDNEEDLKDRLEGMQADRDEWKDKYIRLSAEFDNFKKRIRQESDMRVRYALQPIGEDLLPTLDNFERALAAASPAQVTDDFLSGISMVQKLLIDALVKHKIEKIEALGQPFDPNLHESVGINETDEYPENHVCLILREGYLLHDRVIRPAMVQIAKPPNQSNNS